MLTKVSSSIYTQLHINHTSIYLPQRWDGIHENEDVYQANMLLAYVHRPKSYIA